MFWYVCNEYEIQLKTIRIGEPTEIYEDFSARIRNLMQEYIIESHTIVLDANIYPYLRYLLLVLKPSYVSEHWDTCKQEIHAMNVLGVMWVQGPLLLTWFNFNPSMDKYLHSLWYVGWNYLSIPKLNGVAVEV